MGRVHRLELSDVFQLILSARQVRHIIHTLAVLHESLVPGVQFDKNAFLVGAR